MNKYNEILVLKDMLERAEIPFQFRNLYDGFQILYPENGEKNICSVIEHDGSYGREQDLLEIMGLLTDKELQNDDVVGFLSAENVFERIKKHYEKAGK